MDSWETGKDRNMAYRIALIGADAYFRSTLADLLRDSGFEVELHTPNDEASIFEYRLNTFDIVIVSSGMAAGLGESTVLSSLLAARGFLIFQESFILGAVEPIFMIHAGLSPEDIIARINNVLHLNSNLRKSTRVRVNLPVDFEYGGKCIQSTLQDIGESGVFIITLSPPAEGTRLSLRFALPGLPEEIQAEGSAVYSIRCDLDQSIISHPSESKKKIIALPGFGVLFESISDTDRQAIRDFVRKQQ